jgi:hypothetical protein
MRAILLQHVDVARDGLGLNRIADQKSVFAFPKNRWSMSKIPSNASIYCCSQAERMEKYAFPSQHVDEQSQRVDVTLNSLCSDGISDRKGGFFTK